MKCCKGCHESTKKVDQENEKEIRCMRAKNDKRNTKSNVNRKNYSWFGRARVAILLFDSKNAVLSDFKLS